MDARAPNYELAELDYMSGMKYKDIAEKYSVSLNTVKSWKTRYEWSKDKKGVHTKKQKVCTQNQQNIESENEPVVEEVNEVLENAELTDKQRLFCMYFIKSFNATRAYQKAYNCSYEVAMINGCRMLRNAKIKKEIERLKKERLKLDFLSESDIFQKYMDIAFGDIGDYVKFGKKQVPQWAKDKKGKWIPVIDPNTNMQKIVEYSYVDLKESNEVDTSIISEVSEGKNGIKIKFADRMRALDWLASHMSMATEEQKARLELLRAQKAKLEQTNAPETDAGVLKLDELLNEIRKQAGVNDDTERQADGVRQEC